MITIISCAFSTLSNIILVSFVGMLFCGEANAQESTNASGGNASGGGGSISYSLGQVACSFQSGIGGSSEQGVQHAYEIYSVGTEESVLSISLTAFPNPTIEKLTLQISNFQNENMSYLLLDNHGKEISFGQINSQQTEINMFGLPMSVYLMKIFNQENTIIQSFKIIKN